jgi:hypothetical protein
MKASSDFLLRGRSRPKDTSSASLERGRRDALARCLESRMFFKDGRFRSFAETILLEAFGPPLDAAEAAAWAKLSRRHLDLLLKGATRKALAADHHDWVDALLARCLCAARPGPEIGFLRQALDQYSAKANARTHLACAAILGDREQLRAFSRGLDFENPARCQRELLTDLLFAIRDEEWLWRGASAASCFSEYAVEMLTALDLSAEIISVNYFPVNALVEYLQAKGWRRLPPGAQWQDVRTLAIEIICDLASNLAVLASVRADDERTSGEVLSAAQAHHRAAGLLP